MHSRDSTASMQVVDDFLEAQAFAALQAAVLASSFPWERSEVIANARPPLPPEHNRQWVHGFYLDKPGLQLRSPLLALLDPVLARLRPRALIKAKLNLTPRQDTHVEYGLHVDTRRRAASTAIFYFNNNNGYTLFEDGVRMESVANRVVIFKANRRHTGAACTDAEFRLVLNLNMLDPDLLA